MIILAELVFYCGPVVLSHGTSSHVILCLQRQLRVLQKQENKIVLLWRKL